MNLREKLKYVLPNILPADPTEAMKGTELIRLVKMQLPQEYSDATIRYHFSIMCCDPTSPIAKVEQGQGYYQRVPNLTGGGMGGPITPYQAKLGLTFENQPEIVDQAVERQQKLRAIYCRLSQIQGNSPFLFEHSFVRDAPLENVWKCPDVAVVDWQLGDEVDTQLTISPDMIRFKQALGVPLFSVTSVKLKLEVNWNSMREDFFQALSNSSWSNQGELVVCAPLLDEQLAEELRRLGNQYGVGISSLGVPMEVLDDIIPHWAIRQMTDREFEALQDLLKPRRLTSSAIQRAFNWPTIEQIRRDNKDFENLWLWIARSLREGRVISYQNFALMSGTEKSAERQH